MNPQMQNIFSTGICRFVFVSRSISVADFFFLIRLSNNNLTIAKNYSHRMESALVIFMNEFTSEFRADIWETTLAHECRRSGLNDGTIRKWRADEDADAKSWLIFSPNDITIMIDYALSFSLSRITIINGFRIIIKHVQFCAHSCSLFVCLVNTK